MAQAEAEHGRLKEGYKQEFLKQSQIKEADAQTKQLIKYNIKHSKKQSIMLEVLLIMLNKHIQINLEKKEPKQRTKNEQKENI